MSLHHAHQPYGSAIHTELGVVRHRSRYTSCTREVASKHTNKCVTNDPHTGRSPRSMSYVASSCHVLKFGRCYTQIRRIGNMQNWALFDTEVAHKSHTREIASKHTNECVTDDPHTGRPLRSMSYVASSSRVLEFALTCDPFVRDRTRELRLPY